jgi:isochorismate synthase
MQKVPGETFTIKDVLSICIEKRLTFAAYRLPGELVKNIVIQKDHKLQELKGLKELPVKKGFLVAPFAANNNNKTCIIRPDIFIRNTITPLQLQSLLALSSISLNGAGQICPQETRKEEFIDQIEQTIREIKAGVYEKVVLSRVKIVQGDYTPYLADIFDILCGSYDNAFIYLFRINGHCWVGATPEPLICTKENDLITVSLAGTRSYNIANLDINNWNRKELIEQDYVTKHIETVLSDHHITSYQKKGPVAKKAGKLLHLRTDFSFTFSSVRDSMSVLINALHPTSAVCGIPVEKALDFIQRVEKHNREYYSGFLGPVGLDDRLQLFVNLRCMKVYEKQLVLYMGSGITADSVTIEEWEETEIKAETMLSVVQQVN